jgi:hypothetical protein
MGVLGLSIVLYVFRKVVQDKQPGSLRQETPRLPDEGPPAVPPPVTLPATWVSRREGRFEPPLSPPCDALELRDR